MKTMLTCFSALSALLVSLCLWANPQIIYAQAGLPPGAVKFDFETSDGITLTRGMTLNSLTVDGLTMEIQVESNGAHDTAMIFDTANPGTADPDLGAPNKICNFDGDGDPSNDNDGPGEGEGGVFTADFPNCEPRGNVLIIPEAVPFIPDEGPDDDSAGGILALSFDVPVRVLQIDILDIDEPTGEDRVPRISFLDENDIPIEFVDVASGQVFTELKPDIAGDNGYEEFLRNEDFSSENEDKVRSIRGNFIGSGALAAVVVLPNPTEKPAIAASRTDMYTLTYTVENPSAEDGGVPVENVTMRAASPEVTINCPKSTLTAGEFMSCQATATNIAFRKSRGWVTAEPVGGGDTIFRVVAPDHTGVSISSVNVDGQDVTTPPSAKALWPSVEVVVTVDGHGPEPLNGWRIELDGAPGTCDTLMTTSASPSASPSPLPPTAVTCRAMVNIETGPQILQGTIRAASAEGVPYSAEFLAYLNGELE